MPIAPTYPGVYIDELPSGVRTITGVATSITAFMGRAQRGPVNQAVIINSFRDFERQFGGLWLDSPMTFAVSDFFRNGGSQAIIVRLYKAQTTGPGVATLVLGTLTLEAINAGTWGNNLTASIDWGSSNAAEVATQLGVLTTDLFNVNVTYNSSSGPIVERFTNLTVKDTSRRVDRVLLQSSNLVRVPAAFDVKTWLAVPAATPMTAPTLAALPPAVIAPTAALDSLALSAATDFPLDALERADSFNLLCIPPDTQGGDVPALVYSNALDTCVRRRAVLIVDPPSAWKAGASAVALSNVGLSGPAARNAAVYYPRVLQSNPLRGGQIEEFVPCGLVAGIISRTDAQRGIWKAPAGLDAALAGVSALTVKLTDAEAGLLNPLGVNCLRTFPTSGQVIWGARTLRGADQLADDYKYLPVRRLAIYLEESLYRGSQWAVFEPNDEALWAQLRLNVGSFMQGLFRQGAFKGQSANEAYYVKCDKSTTTAADINLGIVNIEVGFAPVKPAEFVIIRFQQLAGQSAA